MNFINYADLAKGVLIIAQKIKDLALEQKYIHIGVRADSGRQKGDRRSFLIPLSNQGLI
jgi:hypothetical protein